MRHARQGSALFMALIVLTMLTMWAVQSWRMTALMLEGVRKRQEYEQRFRLADALMHYGMYVCKNHLSDLLNVKKTVQLRLGPWPLAPHYEHYALLAIAPTSKKIKLTLDLYQQDAQKVMTLGALVHLGMYDGKQKIIRTSDWKIYEE